MFQTYPFYKKLNNQERELLNNSIIVENYKKGSVISRNDENCKGVLFVKKGQLRIYLTSLEGREITLYRLYESDVCVLSASCVLSSINFDVTIEAFEDTIVQVIPSSVVKKLQDSNPYFEIFLLNNANERFSDVIWTMQEILFSKLDKRIINFLWDEYIKNNDLCIRYTHDEIAKLIGSSREVVTKMLTYFAKEGIIKLSRGTITIVDKEKIKSYL